MAAIFSVSGPDDDRDITKHGRGEILEPDHLQDLLHGVMTVKSATVTGHEIAIACSVLNYPIPDNRVVHFGPEQAWFLLANWPRK